MSFQWSRLHRSAGRRTLPKPCGESRSDRNAGSVRLQPDRCGVQAGSSAPSRPQIQQPGAILIDIRASGSALERQRSREAIMRAILRAFLVLLLLAVIGFVTLDYWTRASVRTVRTEHRSDGVASSGSTDTEKARERGAKVGEKAAIAAERVKETVGE